MRDRKITLLGPEGTNLTLLIIFLVLNFISWLTLFTLSDGLSFDLNNSLFRQIVFTLLAVILFFISGGFEVQEPFHRADLVELRCLPPAMPEMGAPVPSYVHFC